MLWTQSVNFIEVHLLGVIELTEHHKLSWLYQSSLIFKFIRQVPKVTQIKEAYMAQSAGHFGSLH